MRFIAKIKSTLFLFRFFSFFFLIFFHHALLAQKFSVKSFNESRETAKTNWAVTATAFKIEGEDDVNHIKIHWELLEDIDLYKIYRDGKFIGQSTGDVYDDYDLEVEKTYIYYVEGYKEGRKVATTTSDQASTFRLTGNKSIYNNYNGKNDFKFSTPKGIKINDQYYRYSILDTTLYTGSEAEKKPVKGKAIYELVSPNGINQWSQGRQLAFYPHPVKFEGVSVVYNKKTQKVVIVAHYEDEEGYVAAKLYLAQVTPGGDLKETFADRPMGYESRDQSIFIDDDQTAYILSATNMNKDVNIYRLDEKWNRPVKLINTVFKGQHRETPYIVKNEGVYYFFSSKASGWYPSQAMYATASNLEGVWTPLKELGNNSTFGSQANSVSTFGSERITYGMYSYRWGAQYLHKESTGNFPRLLFVNFNKGYASMEYYSKLELYEKHGLIPIQSGRNLTLGKSVKTTSTDPEYAEASVVTDGAASHSSPFFKGESVPYSLTIDMEKEAYITEINLATRLIGGSETAYKYTLEASSDGKNFKTINNGMDNWKVGFLILKIEDENPYRYLRLNVHDIVNVHNEQKAEWADGIFEITAFGVYK